MSDVEEIQSLINEAEQLRDAENYVEARLKINTAVQKAMTARNNGLIRTAITVRNSIQDASVSQNESSENRCMSRNPPPDLQCCSDVYEAEESEVQKRLDANDGTIVVEYQATEALKKYVCFNRSMVENASRLRGQTVRLCTPLAATTNSEMRYSYANNYVSTRDIKYVVKPSDKVGDTVIIDVPEADGSIGTMEVELPSHTDKYSEPLYLTELMENVERTRNALERYNASQEEKEDDGNNDEDLSRAIQLEEEYQFAVDRLAADEEEEGVNPVSPGNLIYFDTGHVRQGPAGSNELYVKLRFFGLDVGGVINLKDFLYQVIGFPEIKRFVITQESPETFIMLSNGLSVSMDVARTYEDFNPNLTQAINDVVSNLVDETTPGFDSDTPETINNWIIDRINDINPVYKGEDKVKRVASESARSIQEARSDVSAVTNAQSASHCQIGQETTVWNIAPAGSVDVSKEEEEAAMQKVMEMYAIAEYKPITIQDLRSKVLDIMKDLYMENEGVMKGMDISDPNNFDVNDIIIPEYTAPPFDQLYDSDEESVEMTDIDENQRYAAIGEGRGVSQLRCFIAQNLDTINQYSSADLDSFEAVANAFNIRENPPGFSDLADYLNYEVEKINSTIDDGSLFAADDLCNSLSISVDGVKNDPNNYHIVVRSLGMFSDEDEPQGVGLFDDSDDEFNSRAEQVANNLGFIADSERYEDGGPLTMEDLNTSSPLSEVSTIDENQSDNESLASFGDFQPPESPESRRQDMVSTDPQTPIQLAPRLSDGVDGVEDLNEPSTLESPSSDQGNEQDN